MSVGEKLRRWKIPIYSASVSAAYTLRTWSKDLKLRYLNIYVQVDKQQMEGHKTVFVHHKVV